MIIRPPFDRTTKYRKTRLPIPKSIKISKKHALIAQGFNFDDFLMPFETQFSIHFRNRLNLLICSTYNAKTVFLQCQASLLGPHFSYFVLILSKINRFGDPFKVQWAPKSADTGRCQALSNKRM